MTEIRFSYNPFTKDYIESGVDHATAIANKGKTKEFDEYIRGILVGDVVYLRLYYPFPDLSELSLVDLKQKSYELLLMNKHTIIDLVKSKFDIDVENIQFNVENDLLQGIGLANI